MRKYIYTMVCILYSFIKFSIIKLFHLKGFRFNMINIISPLTAIEIDKNSKLKLGKKIKAYSGTKIKVRKEAIVEIGDNSFFNNACMIVSHQQVKIGHDVQFGPNVLIFDHDHDFKIKDGLRNLRYTTASIEIGNNVWVGANTIILKGTKIGDDCVVGAGCIIKGELPNKATVTQKRETEITFR